MIEGGLVAAAAQIIMTGGRMIKPHIEKKNGVWVVSDSCRGKRLHVHFSKMGQYSFLTAKAQQFCNALNAFECNKQRGFMGNRDGTIEYSVLCDPKTWVGIDFTDTDAAKGKLLEGIDAEQK